MQNAFLFVCLFLLLVQQIQIFFFYLIFEPLLAQPTLNKDRGRYKLPNVYDPVLMSLPKVSNSQEFGHSVDESCSESN